jgi:hypothetical protein
MENGIQVFLAQLLNLQGSDQSAVAQADSYIGQLISNSARSACEFASTVIMTPDLPIFAVQQSLLIIKSIFTPRLSSSVAFLQKQWRMLPLELRDRLKAAAMHGILCNDLVTRRIAAVDVALLAQVDMMQSGFSELLRTLASTIAADESSMEARIGSLYALQEITSLPSLPSKSDSFMTTCHVEVSPPVCVFLVWLITKAGLEINELADMIRIFASVFHYFGDFFHSIEMRSDLLAVISQILQTTDQSLHFAGYNLLFAFFSHFYDDIMPSMQEVFQMTIGTLTIGLRNLIPAVLDFWSQVADFELVKFRKLNKISKNDPPIYNKIIDQSCDQLTTIILKLLVDFSDEVVDFDSLHEIDVQTWASKCLRTISELASGQIFSRIVTEGSKMIGDSDWHVRAAALRACSSIVKGDERELRREFFTNNFAVFLAKLEDPVPSVRIEAYNLLRLLIETFWELVAVGDFMGSFIEKVERCENIESPIVVTFAIVALGSFCSTCSNQRCFSTLETLYDRIFNILTRTVENSRSNCPYLFERAIESLGKLVSCTPDSHLCRVEAVLTNSLQQINACGRKIGCVSADAALNEMSQYCLLIFYITQRLKIQFKAHLAETVSVLLKCVRLQNQILFDDALLALVSILAFTPPSEVIADYVRPILEQVLWALRTHSPSTVIVGCVALFRLFDTHASRLTEMTPEFFTELISSVNDDNVPLDAKSEMVRALAQIVMKSGETGYFDVFWAALAKLAKLPIDIAKNREVASKLFYSLIFGFYAMVVVTKNDGERKEAIIKQYQVISGLIEKIWINEIFERNVIVWTIQLMKEVVSSFGRRVNVFLHRKAVEVLLTEGWDTYHLDEARYVAKEIQRT